jgi:hypothetical protein
VVEVEEGFTSGGEVFLEGAVEGGGGFAIDVDGDFDGAVVGCRQ